MPSKFELTDITPAAPSGKINVKWQSDASGNVSAYVDPAGGGGVAFQTPWLSNIDGGGFNLSNTGDIGIGPTARMAVISVPSDGATDSGAMTFWTRNLGASGERMRITAAGNVGIGTASAGSRFVVSGFSGYASSSNNIGTSALFSDGGIGSHMAIVFDTGATGATAFRGFRIAKASQDFGICRYDSAGTGGATIDLTITAAGNVGIGIENAQAPLHIHRPNVGGVDAINALILARVYGEVGDSMDITWPSTARLSVNAVAPGEAGFIFYAQIGGNDGTQYEILQLRGNGQYIFTRLPTSAPARGLWYDPADSNRVKYVP